MVTDVSLYLDPDEMIGEHAKSEEPGESTVMGVTQDSLTFVRANDLLDCEGCENTALHPAEITAVRPRDHAVMMCIECMPKPEIPEEWK